MIEIIIKPDKMPYSLFVSPCNHPHRYSLIISYVSF